MSLPAELGFLVFLNYERPEQALDSLNEGLELFERAEQLGFASGWVRVHHGVQTLSAPFPFLTAAALRTSRIQLGTAVIPAGFEDPLRFAEDAATVDLLSGSRLQLALSSGVPTGFEPENRAQVIADRVRDIQAAVRGEVVADAGAAGAVPAAVVPDAEDATIAPLPHGPLAHPQELRAYPHSPGLDARLWYGAGSLASALRVADAGLNLVLSTITAEADGPTLGDTQAEIITRYRERFAQRHPGRTPKVAVARAILPLVDDGDRERYGELVAYYDRLVTPEGAYRNDPAFTGQASPLYSGTPEQVVAALERDPSLALADTLLLTPLSELDTRQKLALFDSVTSHVTPAWGWRPAA